MRILAITNLYPNPAQPHRAAFNRQQFRALAAEHELQVIAPIAWMDEWRARRAFPMHHPLDSDRRRISDGLIIHHPRYAYTPGILRRWHGHFLHQSIRNCFQQVIHTFCPDVVLGCWAYPDGWATIQLAREANLPVAVKVHGSDLLSLADHPSRRPGTAEALACADGVIAVSRHLAQHAIGLSADPAKVHVVYNGVNTTLFHPASRQSARQVLQFPQFDASIPLILFVGNLVPIKGVDVLIDALSSLARTNTRFHAAVVGDGPLKRSLQARIHRAGLANLISLMGPRPLEQLPLWYQAADLLVLPSRSEGIPNVLLEAIACETPFVASHVGGIPEIAPPGALVPPGDPVALADRILSALHCSTQTLAATPAASWLDSARALADVLASVAAGRHFARAG